MLANNNTGGKPHGLKEIKQYDDGQPQRCLEVSATLLHGGMDSSRQVTSSPYLQAAAGIGGTSEQRLVQNNAHWPDIHLPIHEIDFK